MAESAKEHGAWGTAPAAAKSMRLVDYRFRGCAALSAAFLVPTIFMGLPLAMRAGLGSPLALAAAAALLLPVIVFAIASRVRGSAVVGTDGVLLRLGFRSRFVQLDEIKSVHKRAPQPEAQLTADAHWRVEIELNSGDTILVPTALRQPSRNKRLDRMLSFGAHPGEEEDTGPPDPAGDELIRTIELARSAHKVRRLGLVDHEAPALDRGTRDGADWLTQLRSLATGQGGGYRRAGVDLEQLPRLVDHAGAKPEARVAAAVVLAEAGDEQARPRLRILADSVAEPRLRKALLRIADADTDEDLAAALERVPEGERERGGKVPGL